RDRLLEVLQRLAAEAELLGRVVHQAGRQPDLQRRLPHHPFRKRSACCQTRSASDPASANASRIQRASLPLRATLASSASGASQSSSRACTATASSVAATSSAIVRRTPPTGSTISPSRPKRHAWKRL